MKGILSVLIAAALIAACGSQSNEQPPARFDPMPATMPGAFFGTFPCENCAGIEVGLWLRPDGAFLLRQAYPASRAEKPGPATAYATGKWRWDSAAALLVLDGRGPDRRFHSADATTLELETSSPEPHLLVADAGATAFDDAFRLEGIMRTSGALASLTECASGATWSIAKQGAHRELMRLNARLNRRGASILAEITARFRDYGKENEALVVENVIALKPGRGCDG